MKKNKKIITSIVGASALTTGIATAAVAQACTTPAPEPPTPFERQTELANAVNEFSNYDDTSIISEGIAASILMRINQQIESMASGITLTTMTFESITPQDVIVSDEETAFSVIVAGVNGTLTDPTMAVSGNLAITARVSNDNETLTLDENDISGLMVGLTPIGSALEALNDPSTRQWSNTVEITEGTFQSSLLSAVFAFITNIDDQSVVDSFEYGTVNMENIAVSGSGEMTQYLVTIGDIDGAGTGRFGDFSIISTPPSDVSTITLSNVLTNNANNIQIIDVAGLSIFS